MEQIAPNTPETVIKIGEAFVKLLTRERRSVLGLLSCVVREIVTFVKPILKVT
jgi:hypothetical protein